MKKTNNCKVSDNDKKLMLTSLSQQVSVMNETAKLLERICPELGHHVELFGAAMIMQSWRDGLEEYFLKDGGK